MAKSQFSLSWDSHMKNISLGLSTLQQKGEFVDMTLAADGHIVKVHQVVVALASPYIKELLSSVECSHPVIFLNKISYKTMCSILEYIYSGEVLVALEELNEFAQAAKDLHIRGLEDMKLQELLSGTHDSKEYTNEYEVSDSMLLSETNMKCETNVEDSKYYEPAVSISDNSSQTSMRKVNTNETQKPMSDECLDEVEHESEVLEEYQTEVLEEYQTVKGPEVKEDNKKEYPGVNLMQYTVSNQGSLQMILNRYLYFLKYTNRNKSRQWRCVDYLTTSIKCPAQVITKNDVVLLRVSAHTHPLHDAKIIKKIRSGAVFTAISEAEQEGHKRVSKSKIVKRT